MASAMTARTPANVRAPTLIAFAKHAAAIRIRDSFDWPDTSTITLDQLTPLFQVRNAIRIETTEAIARMASTSNNEVISGLPSALLPPNGTSPSFSEFHLRTVSHASNLQ
jgi:hypothetical protein